MSARKHLPKSNDDQSGIGTGPLSSSSTGARTASLTTGGNSDSPPFSSGSASTGGARDDADASTLDPEAEGFDLAVGCKNFEPLPSDKTLVFFSIDAALWYTITKTGHFVCSELTLKRHQAKSS